MGVPKILNLCWLQGVEAAPEIVKLCLAEWRRLNPAWEIRVFDKAGLLREIGPFPIDLTNFHQPQALADILRVRLLLKGGVWTDATTYPARPLDDWIHEAAAPSGFFAFDGHRAPLDYSNWFMAAVPDNYIVAALWREVLRYWTQPRKLITFKDTGGFQRNYELDPMMVAPGNPGDTYPFFWAMYLFTYLLRIDGHFREQWARTPYLPATAAHEIQFGVEQPGFDLAAALPRSPIHKLTWKSETLARAFMDRLRQMESA